MKETLVVTLLGADRPGLVKELSDAVVLHDGNWELSSMARLAGRFAGILQVGVGDDGAGALRAALADLATGGLQIFVEHGGQAGEKGENIVVEVVGQDRPGIISDIASRLSARGVNIEELETRCESAAMSGQNLFRMRAVLAVPVGVDPAEVRADLESLAGDLMVDFPRGA